MARRHHYTSQKIGVRKEYDHEGKGQVYYYTQRKSVNQGQEEFANSKVSYIQKYVIHDFIKGAFARPNIRHMTNKRSIEQSYAAPPLAHTNSHDEN